MMHTRVSLGGRLLALVFLLLCLAPSGFFSVHARAQAAAAHPRGTVPNAQVVARHIQAADTAATIVLTPTAIAAGDTVAISGTGFAASENVDLRLATTGAVTTTEHLAYVKAGADGGFKEGALPIPVQTQAGDYQILALGLSSTRHATAALKVTAVAATLSVDKTAIAPDDTIRVQGSKFGAGERILFSLGTTANTAAIPLGHTNTNHAGNFGPVSLHIPFGVPAGKLLLMAIGQSSNRQASVTVTVTAAAPTLVVSPASAKPGQTITISGAHMQPGEIVVVDLVALSTSAKLGDAHVNAAGRFALRVVIPATTPEGTVSVVATGTTSHLSVTHQITIGALPASLTPGSGSVKAGATLSVAGKGFIPGETITLLLQGGKLTSLTLGTVVAGTDGAFHVAHLVVPSLVPAGSYKLLAYGQTSGRSASSTLAVQAPPPAAPILSILGGVPGPGGTFLLSPGGLAEVAGSNFPAHARVTIALASAAGAVSLTSFTASASGALGPFGVTLPASTAAGAYSLEALVGGKKIASIAVHVAPLSPRLSLSTNTLVPGASVGVHGFGFAPGEQVILSLNSAALATRPTTIVADTRGDFSAAFTVPATVLNGTNAVVASGVSSRASAQATATASLPVASRWYFANGDTTGDNRTTINMLNPTNAPATVKMTFIYQAGPEQHYTEQVPPHRLSTVGLALIAGYGRHVSTIIEADRRISASSTINYGGGDSSTALGATGPSTTWYLAEGYTNASFSENLHVMNPNNSYVTLDVRFLPFNNHPAREVRFVMQPESNLLINAGQYMPGQSISAIVTADHPVVVERSMHFGLHGRGAHDKIGITSASTVWMFAQGTSSPSRQTFFTILNPNQAAPAAVTATFFDHAGKPVGSNTIIVDPLHRGNIKLNDILPNAQVATILTSNVPVVVERPSYDGPANLSLAPDGSVVFGQNAGGASWAFPSGNTAGGTQSQISLFNPGLKTVVVRATYYSDLGTVVTQDYALAPNSDTVVPVNSVAGLPAGRYGAVLTSTNGGVFLAEQSDRDPGSHQLSSTQGIAQ